MYQAVLKHDPYHRESVFFGPLWGSLSTQITTYPPGKNKCTHLSLSGAAKLSRSVASKIECPSLNFTHLTKKSQQCRQYEQADRYQLRYLTEFSSQSDQYDRDGEKQNMSTIQTNQVFINEGFY